MHLHDIAVVGSMIYFVGFGAGFVFRPEFAERLGLQWTNRSGRTEVRCYYGAVSWALAAFLGYLMSQGLTSEALVGMIFLSGAVFSMRVAGTFVDGGWSDTYTRQAIPIEGVFVAVLVACFAIG